MVSVTEAVRSTRTRLFWWRYHLTRVLTSHRRAPGDSGAGTTLGREWGGWAIRPRRGIRRYRWAVPLAYTRSIAAGDDRAAIAWTRRMGY